MKKLLIAVLVLMSMVSCTKSFKINVNLENSTGKTVYLQRYDGTVMNNIDSVVAKDNMAVFKVKQSPNTDAYNIMIKGWRRSLTVFADNQNVTITGDYQKYNGINVLASETQEKLNKFTEEVDKIEDEQEIYYFVMDFVKQNIDNPVSAYALYRYKWAFSLEDMERLNETMPQDMQSAYKNLLSEYINALRRTLPGNKFIDFTQKDMNGNDFTMSNMIGSAKIIILDFWASWCPDCRKENPNLVAIYKEFKDKGLDIVSVSLDTDADAWKKAIADDNLTWKNHVSDLKGWKNAVAEKYTIAFIPQNLVLDAHGVILEKNLPDDKMREIISSILK